MDTPSPLEAIFFAALERGSPGERTAYLEAACAGDPEIRSQVERMLAAQARAGSFLESPPPDLGDTVDEAAGERPGASVGAYKLLEKIGEGGFGVVFLAEQTVPVRRKVALKVLKPGMDSRQVVARFEAERQALALMDHPHIAKVFDGGQTPSGRPYFVMELVRGIPVTDYCDRARMGVRSRLGLVVQVCQAVQHAHQKGVIHRDLKPSNVLVTEHDGTPVVKVIDFGVAKALGQELTDKTLFTGLAQMVGTPLYMSPEQAGSGDPDVDTRSDIYSLGVVLYELLTGTTPVDKGRFKKAAYDEIRRIIRDEEPARPSTRLSGSKETLSSVAALRDTEPARLTRLVRGELDWIVMKALEKDRNRRYDTAAGLAADVERYLRDEPVLARAPTARYRLRKFVRRNRGGLAAAVAVAVCLVLLAGGAGWAGLDRAARRAEAGRQAEVALADGSGFRERKRWAEARAAAGRTELLLAHAGDRTDLRDRLRELVADLDMVDRLDRVRLDQTNLKDHWWDHQSADRAYEAAFRDYGVVVMGDDPSAAAERVRASAVRDQLVAALDDWFWVLPAAQADRRGPIRAVADRADPDPWRVRFRDPAVQRDRRALEELAGRPDAAAQIPATSVLIGRALLEAGAVDRAVAVLAAAQGRAPADFWLNMELARVLCHHCKPPRYEEAAGYCRAAIAVRPDAAGAYVGLGACLPVHAHGDEGIAAFRRAIELQPDYAEAYHRLGRALALTGRWPEAHAALRTCVGLNPQSAPARFELGGVCRCLGRIEEAIAEYAETARLKPTDVGGHRELAWLLATCADPALRDAVRARAAGEQALRLAPRSAEALRAAGVARYRTGDFAGAIDALTKAHLAPPDGNPYAWLFLAMACHKNGDPDAASKWFGQAVRWADEHPKWTDTHPVYRDQFPRFRAEAAEVLAGPPGPKPKPQ